MFRCLGVSQQENGSLRERRLLPYTLPFIPKYPLLFRMNSEKDSRLLDQMTLLWLGERLRNGLGYAIVTICSDCLHTEPATNSLC
jgi:hypothetical protein